MKKLIALFICLTSVALVAQAQKAPQGVKSVKNAVLQKAVNQKGAAAAKNAPVDQKKLEQKLLVGVIMSIQTQGDYDSGNLKTTYQCSGVIVNPAGDVAIKKDCLPALKLAENRFRHIHLFIGMSEALGTYQRGGDYVGDSFFYETDEAEARTFVVKENFLVYALPLREGSEVKSALNKAFAGAKGLTAQRVAAILTTQPKARVKRELLRIP